MQWEQNWNIFIRFHSCSASFYRTKNNFFSSCNNSPLISYLLHCECVENATHSAHFVLFIFVRLFNFLFLFSVPFFLHFANRDMGKLHECNFLERRAFIMIIQYFPHCIALYVGPVRFFTWHKYQPQSTASIICYGCCQSRFFFFSCSFWKIFLSRVFFVRFICLNCF